MRCPYLREVRLSSCGYSPLQRHLPNALIQSDDQECSSPRYGRCPVIKESPLTRADLSRCPFFRESRVEYCGAAPLTRFTPFVETAFVRCGSEVYRYCQIYLQRWRPQDDTKQARCPDEFHVPDGLALALNHTWLHIRGDGSCRVGVDAFLVGTLGWVELVDFIAREGLRRSAVVLEVGGVKFTLEFPCRMNVTASNLMLRTHPNRLLTDPYGSGWLLEGSDPRSENCTRWQRSPGLLRGAEARRWMQDEVDSLTMLVRELRSWRREQERRRSEDGGSVGRSLCQYISGRELRYLLRCFFGVR